MASYTLTWVDASDTSTALTSANSVAVQKGVLGFEAPPVEVGWASAINRAGGIITRTRTTERPFTIPLYIEDTTEVDQVGTLFAAFRNGPGKLQANNGSRTRELRDVYYEAGLEGQWADGAHRHGAWAKRTCSFIALDPYWYATTASTASDLSADDSFTVSGDVESYPVITLTGPFTTLTDFQWGDSSFDLSAALADSATIVIDTRPWETFYGPAGPTDPTNLDWSLLTAGSTIGPAGPGSVAVSYTATGTGANTDVTVVWYDRYYTP